MAQAAVHPVTVDLDAPLKIARWRPLVHGILAVPHFIVLYGLQIAQNVLGFISFLAILFTGNIPEGMFAFRTMCYRYQWRVSTYVLFMRESYPPFDFTSVSQDPGTDPARLSIAYPARLSRGLIFVKWLLVLPHIVVLLLLSVLALLCWIGGFLAVLITGRWPQGLRSFLVGFSRWSYRVQAYAFFLTDAYPPFSLS
jgi:hypothetical protein